MFTNGGLHLLLEATIRTVRDAQDSGLHIRVAEAVYFFYPAGAYYSYYISAAWKQ
jgi:hypothetical protein